MSDEIDSTAEEWRAIPGFEGLYSASNLGRIRSEPGGKRRARILKPWGRPKKYVHVNLFKDGKATSCDVHRLVLLSFRESDPLKPEGNHIDLNTHNNRLSNLEWSTSSENKRHSIRVNFGTFPKPQPPKAPQHFCNGEGHYAHKITDEIVRTIRTEYSSGRISQQALADRFGLAQAHVSQIILRRKWKHVS